MKRNGTLLNTRINGFTHDDIGDEHVSTSVETPLRTDAFEMDDELKMELIEKMASTEKQVKGIKFKRNYGKSAALNTGFAQAHDTGVDFFAGHQLSPSKI